MIRIEFLIAQNPLIINIMDISRCKHFLASLPIFIECFKAKNDVSWVKRLKQFSQFVMDQRKYLANFEKKL